jgi:hypothetical protein
MTERVLSLDDAMMGAAEAPPSIRIEFRDPIAQYGVAGIARVMPWLSDPKLSAFAVRVIARAADFDAAAEARRVLQGALAVLTGPARSDAVDALQKLGGPTRAPRIAPSRSAAAEPTTLAELVEGRVYKRSDTHDSGLGGNRQKGISYPAQGIYVLLFSDPDSAHEWGYKDSWLGNLRYRYYGEWNGTGDMLPTGATLPSRSARKSTCSSRSRMGIGMPADLHTLWMNEFLRFVTGVNTQL